MPTIGPMELAVVAIIALVIFGPKKLPEFGSSIGNGIREFKSSINTDQIEATAERTRPITDQKTTEEGHQQA